MQINSESDPYTGYKIVGSWEPGWWRRKSSGTYQRRRNEWQRRNPTWVSEEDLGRGVKGKQCYDLVNTITGLGSRVYFDNILDFSAPRNLKFWRVMTEPCSTKCARGSR